MAFEIDVGERCSREDAQDKDGELHDDGEVRFGVMAGSVSSLGGNVLKYVQLRFVLGPDAAITAEIPPRSWQLCSQKRIKKYKKPYTGGLPMAVGYVINRNS